MGNVSTQIRDWKMYQKGLISHDELVRRYPRIGEYEAILVGGFDNDLVEAGALDEMRQMLS